MDVENMKKILKEAFERERRKKLNEPNKESVVRDIWDIFTVVCASAMIPFAIALACNGELEHALLSLILARLMLMERKNESSK